MSTVPDGPRSRFETMRAYERAPAPPNVRLRLDANEGQAADLELVLSAIREFGTEVLRRYPDARPFEAMLARRFGVQPSQVFVAAGADEVVDRCCRAFLPAGATMVMAEPGFEMFDQYAELCGARMRTVSWTPGAYPRDEVCRAIDDSVGAVALITPNNPTGETATLDDLYAVSKAAPNALVMLDHAYVDFADQDLTSAALALPNVFVVRTFSKAWGLAGCRVGYALGPSRLIRALRAVGGPFPVSAASLAIASVLLERGEAQRDAYVRQVHIERAALTTLLTRLGAFPRRSEANFVFAELGPRSPAVRDALAREGIVVRGLARKTGEPFGLRIGLPGNVEDFTTLAEGIERALTSGPS
jgi:histidinol-phosphate aminotransferase